MSGFETASYCARKLSSCDAVEATKKDKAEKKKNRMTEDETQFSIFALFCLAK